MDSEKWLDGNAYNHILDGVMVVAGALASNFEKMDAVEFERTYDELLRNGEAFAKQDDQRFSASLDSEDGVRYASLVSSFLMALGTLKAQSKRLPQVLRAIPLAHTAALHNALSNFRTMCGEP